MVGGIRGLLFLTVALLACVGEARAEEKEKEPIAIIELGGAVERTFPDGQSSFGPWSPLNLTSSRIGLKSRLAYRDYTAVATANGVLIFYSRSLSLCPRP
jgi:hypothetical protein